MCVYTQAPTSTTIISGRHPSSLLLLLLLLLPSACLPAGLLAFPFSPTPSSLLLSPSLPPSVTDEGLRGRESHRVWYGRQSRVLIVRPPPPQPQVLRPAAAAALRRAAFAHAFPLPARRTQPQGLSCSSLPPPSHPPTRQGSGLRLLPLPSLLLILELLHPLPPTGAAALPLLATVGVRRRGVARWLLLVSGPCCSTASACRSGP